MNRTLGFLQESKAYHGDMSGKTAAEFVERHDNGEDIYTEHQLSRFRKIMKADPKYKPKAAKKKDLASLKVGKDETTDEFIARMIKAYS